ncbi:vesicle-fusing ATPase-like [Halichondria panicea]|uniref:vesicle-fusing ATPase-like n=1 Tax=Halichondria panicea TaxID=6063 RepID=UPI00312B6408
MLRKLPPLQSRSGPHKLLIIGTTGLSDDVLELTGLQGAFNSCIDVPYLSSAGEVLACLLDNSMYTFSESQAKALRQRLTKKSCHIGMKKLISIIEASKKANSYDVDMIVRRLEIEGHLTN